VEAGDGYDEIEKAMDDAHHKAGSRKKLPRTREDLGDFDASISLGHTSPVSPHHEQISGVLAFEILVADFIGVIGDRLPHSRLKSDFNGAHRLARSAGPSFDDASGHAEGAHFDDTSEHAEAPAATLQPSR
jgi:hypothetical protein